MKKLFLLMAFAVWCLSASALVHTVARGESLESIARKYSITVEQLVSANPSAQNLFYVGLKLNIPQGVTSQYNNVERVQSEQPASNPNPTEALPPTGGSEQTSEIEGPGAEFSMMIEYGFLSKPEGIKGTSSTYAFTVGANYFVMEKGKGLFAGARIGYNSANSHQFVSSIGEYANATVESHFITLPINVGWAIATSDKKFALTPLVGIDVNFCVSSKQKNKAYSHGTAMSGTQKYKKKVGADFRAGVQLRLWGFNVGASYVCPLNKNQKMYFGDDSYFAVNIGFGF